jgi:hypothetical protein
MYNTLRQEEAPLLTSTAYRILGFKVKAENAYELYVL